MAHVNHYKEVHTMRQYKTIGLDLAKRNFHFVVLNEEGAKIESHKCVREKLLPALVDAVAGETASVIIAMEACGGCHYWARVLKEQGFQVKVLKTIDVKAYAKTRQKNDTNDALAIAKASLDQDLRPICPKSLEEQAVDTLHKHRETTIRNRVRATNALMGYLHEYGYVCAAGKSAFGRQAQEHVCQAYEEGLLPEVVRQLFLKKAQAIQIFLEEEKEIDKQIIELNKQTPKALRLQTIPGIGPINSSILASLPLAFHASARDFSASLGLVPSQQTTGGVIKLGSISKKGNRYVRTMLVQGARCILMGTSKGRGTGDPLVKWAYRLWKRKGYNIACVALANKLARICYGCIINDEDYTPQRISS